MNSITLAIFENVKKKLEKKRKSCTYTELLELVSAYNKISYGIEFIGLSWGMSSGEYSLLNLFSRLNYALEQLRNCNDVIIILDELDSAFHPRWQQEILWKLVNYSKKYKNLKIQFIITTHSPVMLSDIPLSNVSFIRNNSIEFRDDKKKHEQTFASNIGTLYYDSFFMTAGSIGALAKNVISDIIAEISGLEENKGADKRKIELQIDNLQERINIIGPIWKFKLQQQLNTLKEKLIITKDDELVKKQISDSVEKLKELTGDERTKAFINQLVAIHLEEK